MQITNSLTNSAAGPSERRTAALLSMLAAFAALAIDLYLPALPAIGAGLGAEPNAVQLSVTVFLAGFMLGMLFCGPLSDRLGRRKMLLSGIVVFALASVACMVATSIEQLIVARFLQALGGGTASLLARVVARDLFPGPGAIRMLSLIAMVSAIAPLIAPMAGSVVMMAFGWRGTFGALLVWALCSLLAVWNLLPESLPPEQRVPVPLARVFGVYRVLLGDRALAWLLLSGGMSFAAMFGYITAGPFFFIQLHGFTPMQYSVVFAANALGIFGANYLNRHCAIHPGPEAMMRAGCALALAAIDQNFWIRPKEVVAKAKIREDQAAQVLEFSGPEFSRSSSLSPFATTSKGGAPRSIFDVEDRSEYVDRGTLQTCCNSHSALLQFCCNSSARCTPNY